MTYTQTRNDLETLLQIDGFWSPTTPLDALTAALDSDNWQVQQAALSAIGDRGGTAALSAIEALLAEQDALGVYGCPDQWAFDAAVDQAERETWRCRFRVKQAALIAIGKCVEADGAEVLSEALLTAIAGYAVSQADDYPVRVAACKILGYVDRPFARQALQQAAGDGEWCTAVTARKSLQSLACCG